ncbi:class I adenylate-forming enzyme family protein [Sphingomonas sp. 28-63-12]|uniref:class I adenylate-forming enzyme family protein n=1 Tax=Sphingomonas sp. 28-63-12 TaxID=1970434 RepID=UPI000BDB35EC|nr:MAG: AMP-dependent synthetase [Sphingomonas sp. 28-63-12]
MAKTGEDPAKMRVSATTLGDLLLVAWDRDPEKLAVVFPENSVSFDALVTRVLQRARGFVALGVRPGDHVGILLPSGISFTETLFALAMCGAVSVLLNARYRAPELAYVAENADLTAIVTSDEIAGHTDFVARLTEAFPDIATSDSRQKLSITAAPKLRHLILFGKSCAPGFIDEAQLARAAESQDDSAVHKARLGVRLRDTCMILYTSGTSANPKGCLLSHEAIVREAINLGRNRWTFDSADRIWSPMPLFHIAALLAMLAAIDAGATFYGQSHFDAGTSLKQIEQDRPTMLFLPFVTFYQAMIAHPDFEATDMGSVRLMNSCFAMMPASVSDAFRRKVPGALQCGTFGMTEASGIATTGGYGMDPALGLTQLGFPLAGIDLRIIDIDTGATVEAGMRGEVLIKGYSLFDGYYRDAERTAQALDEDGWFHSGDIGSLDPNGHLMFHGRFKDMLKVGGENVAAAEVEAVLAKHPGVRLAQVVGIPDERLAEVPAAFIERAGGQAATEAELIDFARTQIASFKVPRHIRFVDEWPMGASKIQKFKLRQALVDELGLDGHGAGS